MEPVRANSAKACRSVPPEMSTKQLLRAQALLFRQMHSNLGDMSVKCAVELGIFDAIDGLGGGGPVTAAELSAGLKLHPSKISFLPRLLRLLSQMGLLAIQPLADGGEGYALTPMSKLLVRRSAVSMASFIPFVYNTSLTAPLSRIGDWLRAPAPTVYEVTYGRSFWEYIKEHPELDQLFNDAMACDSSAVVHSIVTDCRDAFDGVASLVDVGGGTGTTAKAIAEAFPGLKCMVLDQPHVVAAAAPEVSCRVTMVGGDMFGGIPKADAVLLKMILHNWNDEDCVRILERCREAIPPDGGKVIVVEMVLGYERSDEELWEAQLLSDVLMTAAYGSSERDEQEWGKIFYRAGFSSFKIKHALGLKSLIEIYP